MKMRKMNQDDYEGFAGASENAWIATEDVFTSVDGENDIGGVMIADEDGVYLYFIDDESHHTEVFEEDFFLKLPNRNLARFVAENLFHKITLENGKKLAYEDIARLDDLGFKNI